MAPITILVEGAVIRTTAFSRSKYLFLALRSLVVDEKHKRGNKAIPHKIVGLEKDIIPELDQRRTGPSRLLRANIGRRDPRVHPSISEEKSSPTKARESAFRHAIICPE